MDSTYQINGSRNGAYWIFGILLFLLGIIVLHALFELAIYGPQANVNILLFVGGTYYVPALGYFFFSALIAAFFFSYFCYYTVRDLKRGDTDKLLDAFKEELRNSERRVKNDFEKKFAKISMDQFMMSREFKTVGAKIVENMEKMENMFGDWRKYQDILDKQTSVLNNLKKKVEDINLRMTPKPYLTGSSDVEKVVGVGKKTAKAFKSAGIRRVEELVAEETSVLAERTGLSESIVAKIQATAKMLLVPGIDLKVVKHLQKIGVHSLEELVGQSPIDLYRKILVAAGKSKDKPNLEEVAFCVRIAQYYVLRGLNAYGFPMVSFPESLTQTKR